MLLEAYESALKNFQGWWKKHYSSAEARRNKPSDKDEKEATEEDQDLMKYFNLLSSSSPNQVAYQFIADMFDTRSMEYLRVLITKARKERKERQQRVKKQ